MHNKLIQNDRLDFKVSSLELPSVPGSSQVPSGRQSGGTRHAKRHVGRPQTSNPLTQMPSIRNIEAMSNGQGPPAEGVDHKICSRSIWLSFACVETHRCPIFLEFVLARLLNLLMDLVNCIYQFINCVRWLINCIFDYFHFRASMLLVN